MPQIRGISIPKESNLRNYFINGDMAIAQRGTSFAAIANAAYSLDRIVYQKTGSMVHTVTQDTDVPTAAQAGRLFGSSLRLNLTTAQTSLAAGDQMQIGQYLEGYNFSFIAQKSFTVSFWVKATLAGVYCLACKNTGQDRSYVAEYTISSANTWEFKTIVIAASPVAGTWNYTTGRGLTLTWVIASGTTFNTTAGAWQTGNFHSTTNQVNGVNTGATDFRVTGVMVNEGPVAAPFKTFSEGSLVDEKNVCLRYYETGAHGTSDTGLASGTQGSFSLLRFLIEKRTTPTMTMFNGGNANQARNNNNGASEGTLVVGGGNTQYSQIRSSSGLTDNIDYSFSWTADAEL